MLLIKRCAVDTNVLLRRFQPSSQQAIIADSALDHLVDSKAQICLFPQMVREFWNTATRPVQNNGFGYTAHEVESAVQQLESSFTILRDQESTYDISRDLVTQHQVSGVQVHDCYLAASMKAHGLTHLLTFNPSDFQRYGITTVDPASI